MAKLVKYEYLLQQPSETDQNVYKTLETNLLEVENKLIKETRRNQLEHMKDKIVLAKKSKGDKRSSEEILEEELNKSANVNENSMIWPIFVQHLKETRGIFCLAIQIRI